MKKLKKLSIGLLDELAKNQQKLCELEMKSIVGGGSGTEDDPYTITEMESLMDSFQWRGGYVEYMGYVAPSSFTYESYYGNCQQYNYTVGEFSDSLIESGWEQVAGEPISYISYLGYIMTEFQNCKNKMLTDIINSGQGNKPINWVVSRNSNSHTDLSYTWNVYDAETGKLITSYNINMGTGVYTKNT